MILKIYKKHWDKSMKMKAEPSWASVDCVMATAFKEQYPDLELNNVGYTTITTKDAVFNVKRKYKQKVTELVKFACYEDPKGRAILPLTVELVKGEEWESSKSEVNPPESEIISH